MFTIVSANHDSTFMKSAEKEIEKILNICNRMDSNYIKKKKYQILQNVKLTSVILYTLYMTFIRTFIFFYIQVQLSNCSSSPLPEHVF